MNDLLKTSLLGLLSERAQVTTDEMKNAYENFLEEVESLNQPETDHTVVYRALNLTRIELVSLLNHFRYEQGEKCT